MPSDNQHALKLIYNEVMQKEVLLDQDIRGPLFDFLEAEYGKIRILEEEPMGDSRADAVMIRTDSLTGIEIKSDADSYARLSRQIRDYDRFYDYNILTVGTRHAYSAVSHVPSWWGIITVEMEDSRIDFYIARKPEKNPKMDLACKLTLLWRPELAWIQEKHHLPAYKEKSKQFVRQKILQKVSAEDLQLDLSQALFERDYTLIEAQIRAFQKAEKRHQR